MEKQEEIIVENSGLNRYNENGVNIAKPGAAPSEAKLSCAAEILDDRGAYKPLSSQGAYTSCPGIFVICSCCMMGYCPDIKILGST